MAQCELTGKGPEVKHKVSHSNIKTKSICLPNIQKKALFSRALGCTVRLKVTTSTLKAVEHCGGLDKFILAQCDTVLSGRARTYKTRIRKALSRKLKRKTA
ncbi:MAG: hypothetical protein A4S09_12895 [Proteobacteria bacterium SG_bin7]|nr:MAG: hypothetical protein A4S09_12895 [Proteobacteria bacterium SG_bin7]